MDFIGTEPTLNKLNAELIEEWNRAEAAIKRAELCSGEIVVPAINELRYAGRRLIDSLSAESEVERDALLSEAIMDCRYAHHDAIDAQVFYWISLLDRAETKDYLKSLGGVEEVQLRRAIASASQNVAESRSGRERQQEHYLVVESVLVEIESISKKIGLRSIVAPPRRTVWSDLRANWITLGTFILGAVLTVCASYGTHFIVKLFSLPR